MSAKAAYLTFRTQRELDYFVRNVDASTLSTGDMLTTSRLVHMMKGGNARLERKPAERKVEAQSQRRLGKDAEEDVDDIGDLFATS